MKCSDLIELIKDNSIAIYGAGHIAKAFYTALRMQNLEKRVRCFIETDAEKVYRTIHGLPVIGVESVVNIKEMLICIAVHDAVRNEIEKVLLRQNITNFVWIRPYLLELMLGEVIERHRKIETFELMQHEQHDDYTLAVRYLAVEKYYKKNDIGYDIYVKVLSKLCHDEETARKRLRNFIYLIDDWEKNGYRQEKSISIDEKYRRIDGAHRMSLACYHRTKYLYYDLYPYSDNYNMLAGDWGRMGKAVLKERGLNSFELDELEQADIRLRKKWN